MRQQEKREGSGVTRWGGGGGGCCVAKEDGLVVERCVCQRAKTRRNSREGERFIVNPHKPVMGSNLFYEGVTAL